MTRPDGGAVDLYCGLHRRDRACRHPVGSQGADGGRLLARAATRLGAAADRDPAGDARDPAAAHPPVSQPDQELLARGRHRLSRPGLGVRRDHAESDRAGDRNHRHHHGRLSPDLVGHERSDELLWMADQPEHGRMSDTTSSIFVRQNLVRERPAPVKTTGFVGFLRTRLFNSPHNTLITIVSALLLWFILVPTLKFVLVDAVWTGTD